MERVTGIGGIFFKARDSEKLKTWYRDHLGILPGPGGGVAFEWREAENPEHRGMTVWAPFRAAPATLSPARPPSWYRVANLDRLLGQLREAGIAVEDRIEQYEYGRFAWLMDPEGNRIELWEPPGTSPSKAFS